MEKNYLYIFLIIIIISFALVGVLKIKNNAVNNQIEKKELIVYSTVFVEYAEIMKAEFEKKYPGVTVHVINPGGTEAMMKKILSEKANPKADVIHSGSTLNYEFAVKQDLIIPYIPKVEGFDAEIKIGESSLKLSHPDNYYHVWSLMFSGIMYNSEVVKSNNLLLPDSYKDLANPSYKGLIISANPLKSSTAITNIMAIFDIYKDEAWHIWDKINSNILYYSNSSSKIYNLTNNKEFAFAICLSRPVFISKNEGYPVDFIFPSDGCFVYDNAMALVKNSRHQELGKKFIDFILSDQMQILGAEYLYLPVKKGIDNPSESYSLSSISSKLNRVILPDVKISDENKNKLNAIFGRYAWDKTR